MPESASHGGGGGRGWKAIPEGHNRSYQKAIPEGHSGMAFCYGMEGITEGHNRRSHQKTTFNQKATKPEGHLQPEGHQNRRPLQKAIQEGHNRRQPPRGCLLQGVSVLGGVCSWGGSGPGGCLLPGGGIPACTEADTPL